MSSYEEEVKKEFIAQLDTAIKAHLNQLALTTIALQELYATRTEPEEFAVAFKEFLKEKKRK